MKIRDIQRKAWHNQLTDKEIQWLINKVIDAEDLLRRYDNVGTIIFCHFCKARLSTTEHTNGCELKRWLGDL